MNENDNKLIEQFFREAATQQVEDNGFSQRVMMAVNEELSAVGRKRKVSVQWLSCMWTVFCIAAALVVFFLSQGWQVLISYASMLLTNVEVFLCTVPTLFDLSQLTTPSILVTVGEALLAFIVMMILSIIALTRWASQQV